MQDMPNDPILLRSIVNTLLRDEYSSPEDLCDDKGWSLDDLNSKLATQGFTYISEINQYR